MTELDLSDDQPTVIEPSSEAPLVDEDTTGPEHVAPAPVVTDEVIAELRAHGIQVRCRSCGSHLIEFVVSEPPEEPELPPLGVHEHRGNEHGPEAEDEPTEDVDDVKEDDLT